MISRRNLLKSIGLSAFALPSLPTFAGTATETETLLDPAEPEFWKNVRNQFALDRDSVFFNPGTVGAMPKVVVEKMTTHLNYIASHTADWAYQDDNKEEFISGYNNLLSIRTKVGKLINASAAEIAMTDNVTNGMSYIANGLTLQPGDEILTTDQEHGGGQSSWIQKEKRFGAVFKTVAIGKPCLNSPDVYDKITKALTPKTKVLMLSHMISGSGAILPVKELCAEAKRRGIFTVLDGAQTIGHIKVDVKDLGCDAYVGCFHKWIGAPAGTGFMFVKMEHLKTLWTSVSSYRWDDHTDEGFRFTQRGTGNFPVLKGLDAALDFHFELGPDRVYERIKFLGKRLRDGLRTVPKVKSFSPPDESMCAGITVYNLEGWTGKKLQDRYWEKGKMRPRSQGDVFGVRHCTHIFNSEEEIDRAIALVKEWAG
ncbi:MAG: Cysteine desulfurase [Cytophagales bacterium]|jgi:selenocysteine lyase/cysteine desulfurase|nr:aminotransferase class V-fold PLP-dependent enzyme [Bacteroidota bacterium]MBS1980797.1 aminotransferase class V-fold PLP-dependent enzyme [Bacteroidota bacterium]WHZ08147.1 MAG: Cysteine desulfurase [Cytophagales bacterium]